MFENLPYNTGIQLDPIKSLGDTLEIYRSILWRSHMIKKSIPLLFLCTLVYSGCNFQTSEDTSVDTMGTQTAAADDMATAAMEEAMDKLAEGQTATAGMEKDKADALATSISGAVAETLTAIALTPMDSPTPVDTQMETPTISPEPTETPTFIPTDTLAPPPSTAAPQFCYFVLDVWCNTHKGCSTVDVRNQTGMNSTWHIWSDNTSIDMTIMIPAGPCTIETRPGKYNFYITYCGDEVFDFSWQLNDNWWYKLSPCD
jgi:hypothetical protein